MPKRSNSYDKDIAEQLLNDATFAREMILTSIEEFDESVEDALKYTIQKMGAKEFSDKAQIPFQNVSDFIRGKRKIKTETLNKYLAVFNLKSKIVVVDHNDVA